LTNWEDPLINTAFSEPSKFCLKALREGGLGENLFGADILPILTESKSNPDLRSKYVLMQIIKPLEAENVLVRSGNVQKCLTISEFGINGVYLHDVVNDQVLINSTGGHLVRTKPAKSTTGTCLKDGVLSSVNLI